MFNYCSLSLSSKYLLITQYPTLSCLCATIHDSLPQRGKIRRRTMKYVDRYLSKSQSRNSRQERLLGVEGCPHYRLMNACRLLPGRVVSPGQNGSHQEFDEFQCRFAL
ncbi:hypothetical protein CDAR_318101 [Caerostris darwini]|uniref:Secreted protein n=1 Tax=Caerostris darwini TaxID=1538125 RepID=A0AAV4T6Q8_9ARAC|nr:hypothetical protein CDAR_318101 [Caerostris darwini]